MADDHTDKEVTRYPKQWRCYTNQQRCTLIEQAYITNVKLLTVFEVLESMDARTRDPAIHTTYCLALLGNPGVGKTTVVQ
jgi:hypothetical protein